MYEIHGVIKGVRPINFNKPTTFIGHGGAGKKKTTEEMLESCKDKVHRNGHGIFIPEDMFHSCILKGCSMANLKKGRKALYHYLKGAMQVEGPLLLGRDNWDTILETNIIKPDGTLIYQCYPQIAEGWKAEFTLLIADNSIESSDVRIAVDQAGLFIGIGSWRPKYGRFIVESFVRKAI